MNHPNCPSGDVKVQVSQFFFSLHFQMGFIIIVGYMRNFFGFTNQKLWLIGIF